MPVSYYFNAELTGLPDNRTGVDAMPEINKTNTRKPNAEPGKSAVQRLVSRILESATIKKQHSLFSECDGYEFNLDRDDEHDNWYIRVNPVEQGFLYDGWWRDSDGEPIEAALREAIHGAGVLDG
jgi:hypothetical protein